MGISTSNMIFCRRQRCALPLGLHPRALNLQLLLLLRVDHHHALFRLLPRDLLHLPLPLRALVIDHVVLVLIVPFLTLRCLVVFISYSIIAILVSYGLGLGLGLGLVGLSPWVRVRVREGRVMGRVG